MITMPRHAPHRRHIHVPVGIATASAILVGIIALAAFGGPGGARAVISDAIAATAAQESLASHSTLTLTTDIGEAAYTGTWQLTGSHHHTASQPDAVRIELTGTGSRTVTSRIKDQSAAKLTLASTIDTRLTPEGLYLRLDELALTGTDAERWQKTADNFTHRWFELPSRMQTTTRDTVSLSLGTTLLRHLPYDAEEAEGTTEDDLTTITTTLRPAALRTLLHELTGEAYAEIPTDAMQGTVTLTFDPTTQLLTREDVAIQLGDALTLTSATTFDTFDRAPMVITPSSGLVQFDPAILLTGGGA